MFKSLYCSTKYILNIYIYIYINYSYYGKYYLTNKYIYNNYFNSIFDFR